MTRTRALDIARAIFLIAAVAFAWWSFRGRWDEVGAGMSDLGPLRLLGGLTCVVVGLTFTGEVWRRCLRWSGRSLSARHSAAIFFPGQLGKYIPGSLWTFAAQAQLGRDHDVPARISVAASVVFLYIHTLSGVLIGSCMALANTTAAPGPVWWWLAAGCAGAVALLPPIVRLVGSAAVGRSQPFRLVNADLVIALQLMAATWSAYGLGLWLLLPTLDASGLLLATGAFAASHVIGVVAVLAPAGLGPREATLIALLSPSVGFGSAAAAALLIRVIHTLADLITAVGSRVMTRGSQFGRVS